VRQRGITTAGPRRAGAAADLLQPALDRLRVGFALFDAELRLAAWNERFAELRSYPADLLVPGTPLEAFVRFNAERGDYGKGDIKTLVRKRLAALQGGERGEREQELPDGRTLAIVSERVPPGGVLLSYEDVTDARRTERRLRESEQRYEIAMRAINEGVYDWDIANDTVYYSKRVWHAVGLSPEKLVTPGDYFARIHPDDQPRFLAASAAHFKGETQRFELDYRYRASDGTWRWGRQHGVALRDAHGRAYRMVGSVGDITELKERERQLVEQTAEQTAVRELLEAISCSAFDLDAVLRTLIESATRLCRAERGFIFRLDGDAYRLASDYGGVTPEFHDFIAQHPIRAGRETLVGRTALEKRTVHIEDVLADRQYRWPQAQRIGAYRTMLGVPIIHEGTVIGVIALWKERVEPFTPTQIGLVTTFSRQALIAIENARLFNETKEALEQQTATAEILRVISESPGDLDPVFREILERATGLCDAQLGIVFRWDGERYHIVATRGEDADAIARWKEVFATVGRPGPHSGLGRLLVDKQPVHIPDILEEAAYREGDALRMQTANILKARSFLAVPLLKNHAVIGAVVIYRHEVRPFGAKQVELVRVFADQAVIAIENVRLFNETKEALDRQIAMAEVLRVISSSVADTKPVFDKILESCERLFEGRNVGITLVGDDGAVHLGPYRGPDRRELESIYPLPLSSESGSGSAILERRVMHYPDIEGGADVPEPVRRGSRIIGLKSVIFSPMLWEGRGIGAIFVGRATVGEFSEKEIALLKTFADQAVIAIQNARLFHEIQEKSHQLEIADQHKSAFLANMSHELRTPLNAVIGFSEMLAARYFGELTAKQAEYVNDIYTSGRHLLSLINDILDLSKIEAGRMELEVADFDLRAALDNALTLVRERAQRGGVALRLETDPRLGAYRGDERKLKQVVLNLLSNAVKFTPSGGAVSVSAKQVDGNAEIAVSDTGVGIAPADQEAIFEAFRQVGTDVTRKREGTGLGLALTRRFVELHGGTIRLESAPGKGSTFTVTLPVHHGE